MCWLSENTNKTRNENKKDYWGKSMKKNFEKKSVKHQEKKRGVQIDLTKKKKNFQEKKVIRNECLFMGLDKHQM